MRVSGSVFWYTDVPAAQLFDEIVRVGDKAMGQKLRRSDRRDDISPAAYCFVESAVRVVQ